MTLFPQDKERLRQATNLLTYVKNDVQAMDHSENLPKEINEATDYIHKAVALLNHVQAKAKLYGVDVPFPCPVPADKVQ